VGDTFGRYTIVEALGMGGMGQIFRALDNVLERNVALKVIRPDRVASEELLARFFREARLAAKLTHANTLQIYDLGEVGGTPFIAMEHIQGQSLTAYCGRTDVSVERKLHWMLDAARGLAAAHRHGLIHRDVKPGNIMVTDENVVKVVDFGLAKRAATSSRRGGKDKNFQTADVGYALGTPAWMSPEQLEGAEIDARADQFAWGLTTYALIAGKNPRVHDPLLISVSPLDARVRGVGRTIGSLVEKTLSMDPEARYPSMDDLVLVLERALFDPPAPATERHVAPPTARQRATTTQPPPAAAGAKAKWRFERSEDPWTHAPFHAAAFSHDGRRIAAFGQNGMAIHQGKWRELTLPPRLRAANIRCARFAADGSVVVGGTTGLAARILPSGDSERWHPKKNELVSLHGVEITTEGQITFVGQSGAAGVIARVGSTGTLELMESPVALTALVTLASGATLACGPGGAMVMFQGTKLTILEKVTEVDLTAIARLGVGAVAVGADGVAVRIDATFGCRLENVRTTSSLSALCTTEVDAWAGSTLGRIMKRDRAGVWKRMAPDWGVEPRVVAVWAKGVRIRAVCADASRIEGWKKDAAAQST